MHSLSEFPKAIAANIKVVLFDIDDTLTTHGKLTASAYAALERLRDNGKIVIPITGRPAGWCEHIARMWPVDAVVGENGAFYFRYDHAHKKFTQRFVTPDTERANAKRQLAAIAKKILRDVPGAALASDQAYRECDIAIDFCEDVAALPAHQIANIKALMEAHGLTAKVSSIHVNGWFGDYDKLSTTKLLLQEVWAMDLSLQQHECVFIGDSPNDAPMFGFFDNAVGVANVRAFAGVLTHEPAYVTAAASGAGFVELVALLLAG